MDYADTEDGSSQRFLTPKGASHRYGFAVQTFANWRSKQIGPPYYKRGGRVRYDRIECDHWFGGAAR